MIKIRRIKPSTKSSIQFFAVFLVLGLVSSQIRNPRVYAQGPGKEPNVLELKRLPRQDVASGSLVSAIRSNTLSEDSLATNSVSIVNHQQVFVYATLEFVNSVARNELFPDKRPSRVRGVTVLTSFDRFADIFLESMETLDTLIRYPKIIRIEGLRRITPPPPPEAEESKVPSRAIPDEIVRNGFAGLRGKGVIIAVVDTGIDFRHPDFIAYDEAGLPTSRITYLWDTSLIFTSGRGSKGPFSFPNAAPIGTLFDKQQLTAELRRTQPTIPSTDSNGHGTACASIAAGNGNADFRGSTGMKRNEVVGVAPETEIIAVRMGTNGFENDYLLNAVFDWLHKVAGPAPLVVSGSFGGHWDGHDGQSVRDRQINERFSPSLIGRAMVFAAGNEGTAPFHATVTIGRKETSKWIRWQSSAAKVPMNIYLDNPSMEDVVVELSTGLDVIPSNGRWDFNKITKQSSIELTVPIGPGEMRLYSVSGRSMKADLYFPSQIGSRFIAAFSRDSANFLGTVGSPGSIPNAITVGSYDWNNNFHLDGRAVLLTSVCRDLLGRFLPIETKKISCYSSAGPTRDNRTKPDISAPGQWFISSVAKANGIPVVATDTTGNYRRMNGTSAATPYTAGIIALMFQKRPKLTLGQVKDLLRNHASRDGFTGDPPSAHWGAGKLDLSAVQRIFTALE